MSILSNFTHALSSIIGGTLIAIGSWFTPINNLPPLQVNEPIQQNVGANLPSATALFETSLASPLSSAGSSMTLTANAVTGGGALSGYNCFTIDEGSAQAETACGTISGTSVTGLTRGISNANGTSTVAALAFAHRRGANVKITDHPILAILKAQANGEDTYPNKLWFDNLATYSSGLSFTTQSNQLSSVKYAEDYANAVIAGGAPTSTLTYGGKVELATGAEAALGAALVAEKPLALYSAISAASSTANNLVVVTNVNGKIDPTFLNGSDNYSFTASTTFKNQLNIASSTTINSQKYIWPTLSPTASSSLIVATTSQNQISLGWSQPDFQLLGDCSVTVATTSCNIAGLSAKRNLLVYVNTVGGSGSAEIHMRFNGDTGANYAYNQSVNTATASSTGAKNYVIAESTGDSSSAAVGFTFHINNPSGFLKIGDYTGADSISGAAGFSIATGGLVWNNTAQINRIQVFTDDLTATLGVGTYIAVYGSSQ